MPLSVQQKLTESSGVINPPDGFQRRKLRMRYLNFSPESVHPQRTGPSLSNSKLPWPFLTRMILSPSWGNQVSTWRTWGISVCCLISGKQFPVGGHLEYFFKFSLEIILWSDFGPVWRKRYEKEKFPDLGGDLMISLDLLRQPQLSNLWEGQSERKLRLGFLNPLGGT